MGGALDRALGEVERQPAARRPSADAKQSREVKRRGDTCSSREKGTLNAGTVTVSISPNVQFEDGKFANSSRRGHGL